LERETKGNVAIKVIPQDRADAFEVCCRGELQISVLIEAMCREGNEFMVSKHCRLLNQQFLLQFVTGCAKTDSIEEKRKVW